jgi:hypothetical protein
MLSNGEAGMNKAMPWRAIVKNSRDSDNFDLTEVASLLPAMRKIGYLYGGAVTRHRR